MKTEKTEKPYKPVMRELRLGAVANRLALPQHAGFIYWALANVLAPGGQVHVDHFMAALAVRW